MTDIEQLEKTVIHSFTAHEISQAILTITNKKSSLIKQRSEQKGLLDDTYINSELAKLNDLHFIAKNRLPDVLKNKMYYKFYSVAKKFLDADTFNEIEKKIH